MVFKVLVFLGFFKTKNLERSIFFGFYVFFRIFIFRINFALKPLFLL